MTHKGTINALLSRGDNFVCKTKEDVVDCAGRLRFWSHFKITHVQAWFKLSKYIAVPYENGIATTTSGILKRAMC